MNEEKKMGIVFFVIMIIGYLILFAMNWQVAIGSMIGNAIAVLILIVILKINKML